MQKILVSACLLGIKVRYDGGDCLQNASLWAQWQQEERLVAVCPEVAGGLSTPRPPAQIRGIHVVTHEGRDVTQEFHRGAKQALSLCQKHDIKLAILKAKSPSCGNEQIYDGNFTKTLVDGQGITAALLTEHRIRVFNENQLDSALLYLNALANTDRLAL